jgi:phosphatidylserine/phosphatidylglycerophosphate/cardiolipin synthase-like enzyme
MRPILALAVCATVLGCDGALLGEALDGGRRDARALDAARDATDRDATDFDATGVDAPFDDLDDAFVPGADDAFVLVPDDAFTFPADDAFVPPMPGLDAAVLAPDAFVPPAPDAGSTPRPTPPIFEVLFSRRPASGASDTTIESRLIQLIDAAVPGSRIRVAIFTFTRRGPADALIRAQARGVDVRIVLDGGAGDGRGSEVGHLRTGLGTARVRLCDAPGTSCVGSGIMHHKTFLFSELGDGSRNVVVQASHNLSTNQLTMHNNAVIVRGDAALFAAYERTWNDLWADDEIANYYRTDDGDTATRVYFFPRVSGDTMVSVLDNVRCDRTSRIRVAMAFFTNARIDVARALAARARDGCSVRVVAGDEEIPVGSNIASTIRAGGGRLTRYPTTERPEGVEGWGLHSKYILIDAPYAGSSGHRRLVFTGSHNWTGPALHQNDETLLRIENDAVFDAFMTDWQHVRASADLP